MVGIAAFYGSMRYPEWFLARSQRNRVRHKHTGEKRSKGGARWQAY